MNTDSDQPKRRTRRRILVAGTVACVALLALPSSGAVAESGGISAGTKTTSGDKAKLRNGLAIAPRSAPRRVKRAIEAANEIVKGKSYCLGGGHARWKSRCYDCSGTVSYALGRPGARFVDSPMPSGSWARYGKRGKGKWITWYGDSGHVFAVIAGLRLDTSQVRGEGPGWSRNVKAGFVNVSRKAARHKGKF